MTTHRAQCLTDRRDAFETMRDAVAEQYRAETGDVWRPRRGSHVSQTGRLTSAAIDARDFVPREEGPQYRRASAAGNAGRHRRRQGHRRPGRRDRQARTGPRQVRRPRAGPRRRPRRRAHRRAVGRAQRRPPDRLASPTGSATDAPLRSAATTSCSTCCPRASSRSPGSGHHREPRRPCPPDGHPCPEGGLTAAHRGPRRPLRRWRGPFRVRTSRGAGGDPRRRCAPRSCPREQARALPNVAATVATDAVTIVMIGIPGSVLRTTVIAAVGRTDRLPMHLCPPAVVTGAHRRPRSVRHFRRCRCRRFRQPARQGASHPCPRSHRRTRPLKSPRWLRTAAFVGDDLPIENSARSCPRGPRSGCFVTPDAPRAQG